MVCPNCGHDHKYILYSNRAGLPPYNGTHSAIGSTRIMYACAKCGFKFSSATEKAGVCMGFGVANGRKMQRRYGRTY